MLFLFCVALLFIVRGASYFKVFPCSLSLRFVILFSIVITSLGKEGAGCVFFVHLFILYVLVFVTLIYLPLGVGGWLRPVRFVIVALLDFINYF